MPVQLQARRLAVLDLPVHFRYVVLHLTTIGCSLGKEPSMARARDYEQKRDAFKWVDDNNRRLSDFHMQIWHYHEPAWREYKSARAFGEILRQEGFEVEEGTGGMPTAFMATWGEGKPALGTYAEYDAVPGNSQQPVPYEAPREGLNPWAAGHTDPHSMLGTGGTRRHPGDQGRDGAARAQGHAQYFRRTGRESLRLEAGPCRQRLLRRL